MAGFLYMSDLMFKTLSYAVLVRCGPGDLARSLSAIEFVQELLAQGHGLERVFFYQQGVLCASNLRVVPQGEVDITALWQTLAQEHGIELGVCIAGALHNGIVDAQEAERYELDHSNLALGFSLVGLGQLAAASADCDRLVSFGAGV